MSRLQSNATTRALELVRLGISPAVAAQQAGINRVTMWRALRAEHCPTCGQRIKAQK